MGRTLRRLFVDRLARLGMLVILVFLVCAVFAPHIAPRDPLAQDLRATLAPPSSTHRLGTDLLGRDVLSRLIYGARISLLTGIMVVGTAVTIGCTLGSMAGYFGGRMDNVLSRVTDVVLAFPGTILALAIAGMLGPGLFNAMMALAVTGWPSYFRVMRGQVLALRERDFVEAARAAGASDFTVILRHVIPNCLSPIVVMATLGMGGIILAAAGLSFLGLGAQPPTPEWGAMLNEARPFLLRAPHLSVYPGIAIMLVVLGFNVLGDAMRDVLDPRTRQQRCER
jgi:peptide/nickel transport system permease protein